MASLFWIQLRALIWKNWIVQWKSPILNIFRAFVLPVAFGAFLAAAQLFLSETNEYGIGDPVPIHQLASQFHPSLQFIWADNTDGTSSPTPLEIISRITSGFNDRQLSAVKQVDSAADIPQACPQNFNLFSPCFAAIAFYDIPQEGNAPVNYTIYADSGLTYINVVKHTSDFEKRVLPLQWAVDQAIIELQTGAQIPTPLEWPFTQETNEEQKTAIRLDYVNAITDLLVLALFINFVGITYQLPGSVASERANGLTSYMKAMGLMDKARVVSWHLSISITYLPAWIIISILWRFRIWAETNVGIILLVHLLFGLSLASWSLFVAAPFGKSPQLAAVVTTFLAIILAVVGLIVKSAKTGTAFILTLVFPPSFYVFATRAICGYESQLLGTNLIKRDPEFGLSLLPLVIAALINIFLWPYIGVLWERRLYEARIPRSGSWWKFWARAPRTIDVVVPDNVAISVRNLNKVFGRTSRWSSKVAVTAIEDLTFDVPKTGIFVLLGSNGAGKSTTMSIVGGLDGPTGGQVIFEGGHIRPPRGTIGIVPQKNVLFPELSCLQTLRVWKAVKWSPSSDPAEDPEQLLQDCDLGKKINANANTLSGGQKRKLQLAIGLLGGSKIVLVDECTSGVDPLSRRALWRTLTSFREDRAIVFTTHFLDEADLLADDIAILATPGKLVAAGSPVTLKRDLGEGYSILVSFAHGDQEKIDHTVPLALLGAIRSIAPETHMTSPSPNQRSYHLKSKDTAVVQQVLELLESQGSKLQVSSYDILGTTIEDIFLDLMAKNGMPVMGSSNDITEKPSQETLTSSDSDSFLLTDGRPVFPFWQALTIFHKRVLVARRSWLTPVLTILLAIAGACIPLIFIKGKQQFCERRLRQLEPLPLDAPIALLQLGGGTTLLTQPPGVTSILGLPPVLLPVTNFTDNNAFTDNIRNNYRNLTFGGVSITEGNQALFAWEATPPGLNSVFLLNLVSNVLYNQVLESADAGSAPKLIRARYASFPGIAAGTLVSLRWIIFFGAIMAVYPAFYALYVSRERRSSVQAMQLSNGLSDPIGLWLGHLLFDTISVVILSTIIVIVFAAASPGNFNGLGFLWFIMVLYGIAGALFAYCASLWMASPLAAFAAVAGYQFVVFILYLVAYLLVLTYGETTSASKTITIVHFTVSLVAPVCSVTRAALVSVNLFQLLCDGRTPVTAASMGVVTRYGGPIMYLFVWIFILLAILVWADSGSQTARRLNDLKRLVGGGQSSTNSKEDIAAAEEASHSSDLLRVQGVSKTYGKQKVVDDVSFSLPRDTVFALLGPNGAGKTTTFNMIRGDVIPDSGDVVIGGTSVVEHPRSARANLGVCPQFTAIDSQLTVREHLIIYGRLKGLTKAELVENVEIVLKGTALSMYADRLASKLSGGNQRKLALAIALIGNPSVVLIDEFSTGIDPKMKRDMWHTLRKVAVGKAVIITTHSMEEASALANKVGILAKRMLVEGTTESLAARYGNYEVHFTCRSRDEIVQARALMANIPGAKMADDVATRFEVPIDTPGGISLAQLFRILSTQGHFTEYTVEKASLESIFLKVIRENDVLEEDPNTKGNRWCGLF